MGQLQAPSDGLQEVLIFVKGGKPENPEKNPRSQPTYDAGSGNRTRAILVGGERCAIPAPHVELSALTMRQLLLSCSKGKLLLVQKSSFMKTMQFTKKFGKYCTNHGKNNIATINDVLIAFLVLINFLLFIFQSLFVSSWWQLL